LKKNEKRLKTSTKRKCQHCKFKRSNLSCLRINLEKSRPPFSGGVIEKDILLLDIFLARRCVGNVGKREVKIFWTAGVSVPIIVGDTESVWKF
jgi:hypothetical protein